MGQIFSSSKTPEQVVVEPQTQKPNQTPVQKSLDQPVTDSVDTKKEILENPQENLENPDENSTSVPKKQEGQEEEEEEEGECGFCVYMKGGGCKDSFVAWENCVANEDNVIEKCFEVTVALRECMSAHRDYYAPILAAEEAFEAREKAKQKEIDEGPVWTCSFSP